jgi:hypothetical protein
MTQQTLKDRVLAVIKAYPGLSNQDLHKKMPGASLVQTRSAVSYLASRHIVVNKAKHKDSSRWHVAAEVKKPAPVEDDKPAVLRGPSFVPQGNYTPSAWAVRDGGNDAFQLPSRRGDELAPHSPPLGMCCGKLVDGRSLAR